MLKLNIVFEESHVPLVTLESMTQDKQMYSHLSISQDLVSTYFVSVN